MTKITNFTNVPNRGQSQEDLVNTTNAFFSDVASFVTSANAMREEMQNIAENSLYSNPVWEAQVYPADYSVNYNGNCYISTTATLATDVPGVSAKWKQTNASAGGADIQVFTFSGTWTKPQGAKMVRIILCGGGGGGASGGKCGTETSSITLGGGGGGGAGVADITVPASMLSATQSVTIGAGGLGGTGLGSGAALTGYTGIAGGTGGNTSFGGFTAYGGTGGKVASLSGASLISCANGGGSYISSTANLLLGTPMTSNMEVESTYAGATVEYLSATQYKKQFTIFGGSCSQAMNASINPYTYYNTNGAPSIFGGSAGGTGNGFYLTNSTTRGIANAYNAPINSSKFLASVFGSYTSVGGYGGTASQISNGINGANATGYGAGGGGGGACVAGYTNGNGGNGSGGIAIIISW